MREKVAPWAKTVLFLCLGAVIFWKIQDIIMPSFGVDEYKVARLESNDVPDFDILFLGSSHAFNGVSPMELYKEHKVRSFNLSTRGQSIGVSYFLLEETFRRHSFEAVFLDASTFFVDEKTYTGQELNSYWRYVLDNLKPGPSKYNMAKDYVTNSWSDGFLSAVFPILAYHSNWTALTEENFFPSASVHDYDLGQAVISETVPAPAHFTPENIDYATNYIHCIHSGMTIEAVDGSITTKTVEEELDTTSISEENLKYFLSIKKLCEKHGTKLVLFKVPTMRPPQWYNAAWTRVKSELVSELAQQYGLEFWDIQFGADIELSLTEDTCDAGYHLNALGAAKVTDYMGARIMEEQLATSKTDPVYDQYLRKYQQVFTVVQLQTTCNFYEYLSVLSLNKQDWTILVAVADDYMLGSTGKDIAALKKLGFILIEKGGFRDSYIGIISAGETLYEAVSDYELEYEGRIAESDVSIHSKNGWIQGPGCSIKINGVGQAISGVGLNFVVFDNKTGCVLDSIVFDNSAQRNPTRNQNWSNIFLRSYETALCAEGSAST